MGKMRLITCNNISFIKISLVILVWSIPFMLNNYLQPIFPGPIGERVQLSEIVFLVLLVAVAVKLINRKLRLAFINLKLPLILYGIVFFLSCLDSTAGQKSLIELLTLFYLIGLYLVIVNALQDEKSLTLVLNSWAIIAGLVALAGIAGIVLAWLGFKNPFVRFYPSFLNGTWRLTSTLSLPNMAYSYFHISFFLALGTASLQIDRRLKILMYTIAILILIAILLTFSRGWFALIGGMFLFFRSLTKRKGLLILINSLAILALLCFFLIQFFISFTTDPHISWQRGFSSRYKVDRTSNLESNLYKDDVFFEPGRPYNELKITVSYLPGWYWIMKRVAIEMARESPWLGVGPGGFNASVSRIKKNRQLSLPAFLPQADPHSTYFGSLAETGVLGLGALLILYFSFFKKSFLALRHIQGSPYKRLIWCYISAFAGLLIFAIDVDIMNFRWLWLLLGLWSSTINICYPKEGISR